MSTIRLTHNLQNSLLPALPSFVRVAIIQFAHCATENRNCVWLKAYTPSMAGSMDAEKGPGKSKQAYAPMPIYTSPRGLDILQLRTIHPTPQNATPLSPGARARGPAGVSEE